MLHIGRHRRRRTSYAVATEDRPRTILRLVVGIVVLIAVWYVGKGALSLFSGSSEERSAVMVRAEGREDVEVSLQGEDALRAENGLKLYPGDSAFTRDGSFAVISFFDGTLLRLDEETELTIEESDYRPEGVSMIALTLEKGRVWVMTPSAASFSGSIMRSIDALSMQISVPSDSEGLIAQDEVFFIATAGAGAEVTVAPDEQTVIVGEGQHFALTETAKRDIEAGADPYLFRDPVAGSLLAAPFIQESRVSIAAITNTEAPAPVLSGTGSTDSGDILSVTSPANNAIIGGDTVLISGQANSRVNRVDVNGYTVAVDAQGMFSQELTLPNNDIVLIEFKALDDEGLVIAQSSRTIQRNREPPPPPVITAPGESDSVVTITNGETDITGTAPAGTEGIIVNDYRLQLFKPGSRTWSYIASLQLGNMREGENVYRIVAVNAAGVQSEPVSITVNYLPNGEAGTVVTPPATDEPSLQNNAPLEEGSITMKLPARGETFQTSEKEIVLEGNTSANTASVSVNGYQLQLYEAGKTFWNYIASVDLGTMKQGNNVYRIVARDSEGRVLDILEYTITYVP